MKVGQVLDGYRVLTPPTNAGGGQSQWTVGEREGRRYFMKMFLAPKFPLPDAPGSEAVKAQQRARCHAFERRHLTVAERMSTPTAGMGNLVLHEAFFRVGATYLKVMPWIEARPLPRRNTLSGRELGVVLKTLVLSVRAMHHHGVVHGDLKPDNVLIARTEAGLQVAKLIDLDEAYIEGEPPPADAIVGDPTFYAPELLAYIKSGEGGSDLGPAADAFSLGVLLCEYLGGDLPRMAPWAQYPCEYVLAGHPLDLDHVPGAVQPLVTALLAPSPSDRPTLDDVLATLDSLDLDALASAPLAARRLAPPPAVRAMPPTAPPAAPPPTEAPLRPAPTERTTLRSTMGRHPEEDR